MNETGTRTSAFGNTIKSIASVVGMAIIVATLFTAAIPEELFSSDFSARLAEAIQSQDESLDGWPTATPRPKPRIGIVAGHWGDTQDPGAVCPDGLTELSINQKVAALVQNDLVAKGFDVKVLKEFDQRLEGYRALALVSIHADSCDYINDQATGFKVSASKHNPRPERTARMVNCIRSRYAQATGLDEHPGITADMSDYHAFGEINAETPAVIIETGFMNLDRQILTQNTDIIASGIADGILCYIRNESITLKPTPNEP
ncbi:MAG: N-acetylmuramoyl-L-alanine amidase [Chloroflexota bacterium]|nr:N-acetylmuramoyl-L-alanine amidase [Chloroflexota bacterium]